MVQSPALMKWCAHLQQRRSLSAGPLSLETGVLGPVENVEPSNAPAPLPVGPPPWPIDGGEGFPFDADDHS